MKKIFSVFLCVVIALSLGGCNSSNSVNNTETPKEDENLADNNSIKVKDGKGTENANQKEDGGATKPDSSNDDSSISSFNITQSEKSNENEKFEDITPLYNVSSEKQFTIKLNLGTEPFDTFGIEDCFNVYTDRECNERLIVEVKYNENKNTITIGPDEESWSMYPRTGVDTGDTCNWGALQTYYLVIEHDVLASKVTKLEKPKRMMFTIASPLDIPTVTAKPNSEGNITLYWDSIPGASEYKVYRGSKFGMEEIAKVKGTEFALTEDEYRKNSMNTLLSEVYEYAVTAIDGSKESRLSNVIRGEDYDEIAPRTIAFYEENTFEWDCIDSLSELPRSIDVEMVKYSSREQGGHLIKSYPVVWDFENKFTSEYDTEHFKGKVIGTTFYLEFYVGEKTLSEQAIKEFYDSSEKAPSSIATDTTDRINIPNAPSNTEIRDDAAQSDITSSVDKQSEVKPQENLEITLAKSMLNHESEIDVSAYPEAGDAKYLKDMLSKVLVQYPLILDEEDIRFDFRNQTLIVEYSSTKEEAGAKQKEIQEKVQFIVSSVIKPDMTVEEKEKALHDWLVENATYHDEILEAYMNGEDLHKIATKYRDSFNAYGVLINGLGVCQSYAEAYKLLCDAAEVPCVVITGTLGPVPHAWNKVKLDKHWYHIDVTNNDGEFAIPYAVFNASDVIVASDFSVDKDFDIDSELQYYESNNDDKDYYFKIGSFATSEDQLQQLLNDGMSSGNDFYVKVVPDIEDSTIERLLYEAYETYGEKDQKIMYGKMFNIVVVKY